MGNAGLRNPKASKGQSLIELALILPVLLLLALGVVDFARAIQFNNILVSMSREGANLASRTSYTPQSIIAVLNNTAEPMVMATNGMMYITRIMGRKVVTDPPCVDNPPTYCPVEAKVQAQNRATTGDMLSLPSRVWAGCGTGGTSWQVNGSCFLPPSPAVPPTANLAMTLRDGEDVYAVEALYNYDVIVHYVMTTGPKLYSLTVL